MAQGKKGRAADRSVGSTILFHIRSGIPAFNVVESDFTLPDVVVNPAAEVAIKAEIAMLKDFMVSLFLFFIASIVQLLDYW